MAIVKAIAWGIMAMLAVLLLEVTLNTVISMHARGDLSVAIVFVVMSTLVLLSALVLAGIVIIRMVRAYNQGLL